ncbi:MAG: patatin-like phospholipase family protein, partial [Burkholderiales bacterium]
MRKIPVETMIRPLLAAIACAGLALPAPVFAAETTATTKAPAATPRIGLALSGGGARGLAHLGVLQVLEELRVPVHCITGTSMGAIVGGAYASGTPAARLQELVVKTDWNDLFRDSPPRTEIASRRRMDDYKT